MPMSIWAAWLVFGLLPAEDPGAAHRAAYEKAVPSVVGVRAKAPVLGERSGTGIVLTGDGLILTSSAVVPEGSTDIRVWIHGPRRLKAELVAASPRDEVALIKVDPPEPLRPAELGVSSRVKIGKASYTIGNAANSIIVDDQPSFNAGIVSGLYRLAEPRANSTYVGWVLETTAAVAMGMEGAPCLDAKGRVIGMITLNYSPHRFLGAAIPIDDLKPVIARLRAPREKVVEEPAPAEGAGWLGLELKEEGGKVLVARVKPDGPAGKAGLNSGDEIVEFSGAPVKSAADVTGRVEKLSAGTAVWLKILVEGEMEVVKIVLGAKP